MVSNKIIIILITVAILLSIVSVSFTLFTAKVNSKVITDSHPIKTKAKAVSENTEIGVTINAPVKNH